MTTNRLTALTGASPTAVAAATLYAHAHPDGIDLATHIAEGDRVWALLHGPDPIAVATLTAVPGLPGVFDLELAVAQAHRRQGHGSRLLALLRHELRGSDVRQLAYGLDDLNAPAAHFLLANGFRVEHEEWVLVRPDLAGLPAVDPALLPRVKTLARATAVATFLSLYDTIFAPTPWNQPFSHAELADTLDSATDLLFLFDPARDHPIGLVWLHLEADSTGVIEPVGIVDTEQGKGYGRGLLTIALHELKRRGAQRARIGAWRTNARAIQLYQSLGFHHAHTRTYLTLTP